MHLQLLWDGDMQLTLVLAQATKKEEERWEKKTKTSRCKFYSNVHPITFQGFAFLFQTLFMGSLAKTKQCPSMWWARCNIRELLRTTLNPMGITL